MSFEIEPQRNINTPRYSANTLVLLAQLDAYIHSFWQLQSIQHILSHSTFNSQAYPKQHFCCDIILQRQKYSLFLHIKYDLVSNFSSNLIALGSQSINHYQRYVSIYLHPKENTSLQEKKFYQTVRLQLIRSHSSALLQHEI